MIWSISMSLTAPMTCVRRSVEIDFTSSHFAYDGASSPAVGSIST